jgi:hypothetical protein
MPGPCPKTQVLKSAFSTQTNDVKVAKKRLNTVSAQPDLIDSRAATADEVPLLPHGRAFLLPCASAFQRISVPSGATLVD